MLFKESIHKIVNVIQKIFSQNLITHLFASVADPDPDPSGSEILWAEYIGLQSKCHKNVTRGKNIVAGRLYILSLIGF